MTETTNTDCRLCQGLEACYCHTPRRVPLTQQSGYVDLHFHTEYSSLDGGSVIKQLSATLENRGRKAITITDHGVMNGCPEFYTEMKAAGIKPILGSEIYLAENRHDKSNKKTYHLTLLAETTAGYKNLCKIASYAFIDGVIITFGRPRARADYEILSAHSEGIIALTGCMAAPAMNALFQGDLTKARQAVERLVEIFGKENVYGEIQNVGIVETIPADSEVARLLDKSPLTAEQAAEMGVDVSAGPRVTLSQTEANMLLVEHICKPMGLEYVATGDVHYLEESDAIPHDAMICIPTGQQQKGKRKFSLLPKRYHMRTDDEIGALLPHYPEAIANTLVVAERCNAEIEFGRSLLPSYPYPTDEFSSAGDYLSHVCQQGLLMRYGANPSQEAQDRLAYELSIISKMGYEDYFLIVWDFFAYARSQNIPTGPGRGSAAGSIVAYCLEITQLCPLKYGLMFERFLNPDRVSMPDVDCDFGPAGRGQVMQYVREKYNKLAGCETAVAQIVTFGRFKAKGALRDAARVLADPTEEGRSEALKLGDRLAGYVPAKPPGIKLREAYAESKQLQGAWKNGGLPQDVIKQAQWLEDKIRTNGIHAAAVIIADHPLEEDLPLQRFGPDKPLHVQYDMKFADKLGLLKMDFLGLRNLDVCMDAIEKIKHVHNVELDLYNFPLEDEKTFQLFAEGRTVGTFQFESGGMRESLRLVRPTKFTDLIALVALYRPGSMDYIPTYAARKNGREEVTYRDPRIAGILEETLGICIYQESSMQIAQTLAGFTGAQADDLRKAIGKKDHEKMAKIKPLFMEGCRKNNVPAAAAEAVWGDNEKAADYSFNKSHAACYAYISYVTGYLKANYPNEYMAALLSSVMGKKDEPRLYLTEAKNMRLSVLPPDINRSLEDFSVQADEDNPGQYDILFGLTALKGVGSGVVAEIRSERKRGGPFTSMFDLIRRMPQLNKTVIQALVKGGALDSTRASRQGMFNIVEETIDRVRKEHKDAEKLFIKSVCDRVSPSMFEEPDAQQSLLGSASTKARKLTTWEKRGLEGALTLAWAQQSTPALDEMQDACEAALHKEALRVARADARKLIRVAAADVPDAGAAGIADEEGGDTKTEKELVEEAAVAAISGPAAKARKAQAATYAAAALTAINEEWQARDEAAGLEAALATDLDPAIDPDEWDDLTKLNLERAVLKNYVSGHPLDRDADAWRQYVGDGGGLGEIGEEREGQTVYVVGALVGLQTKKTKKGDTWYMGTLEDLTGSRDVTMFSSSVEGREQLLEIGQVICCEAIVREDLFKSSKAEDNDEEVVADDAAPEREMKLIATKIYRWAPEIVTGNRTAPMNAADAMPVSKTGVSPSAAVSADTETANIDHTTATSASDKPVQAVVITIGENQFTPEIVANLKAICSEYPGEHPLKLKVGGKTYKTKLMITPSSDLAAAIKRALLSRPALT